MLVTGSGEGGGRFTLPGIYKAIFLNYSSHPAYQKPTSALMKSIKRLLLISTSIGSDSMPKIIQEVEKKITAEY